MTAGPVTRWSQRYLATAALMLVAWQAAALAGLGTGAASGVAVGSGGRTTVVLVVAAGRLLALAGSTAYAYLLVGILAGARRR
jgi:hypothetical protein